MGAFSERYLTDHWHQLGTENHVKTKGLCKVTLIYHDNVDEFWHVVCRGHQIETQNRLKTAGFCIMTPIYHDNVSQFRYIAVCRAQMAPRAAWQSGHTQVLATVPAIRGGTPIIR